MTVKRQLYSCVFSLALVAQAVYGSTSVNWIFKPFEYLNMTETYNHYSTLIDLVIYVLIFVGSAKVAFAKRFPGTGGRAITIGIGISLAVAMVIAEDKFHFDLKSFGPVAAGVLILLFGIMIYRLFHYAGMTTPASGAVAYIAVFFAMLAIAPEFFKGLTGTSPVLGAIMVIVLFLAVVLFISSLLPSSGTSTFRERLKEVRDPRPRRARQKEAIDSEVRFIKHWVRPAAKTNRKTSKIVLKDLNSTADAIRRYGHNPQARRVILGQMSNVVPKQHQLQRSVENLRIMVDKLLLLDSSLFSGNSGERIEGMSSEEKDLLKKELRDETERLGLEKRTLQIEKALDQYLRDMGLFLNEAAQALNEGRIEESISAMSKAIESEKAISGLSKQVEKLEYELLALSKRDFRIEKKMAAS